MRLAVWVDVDDWMMRPRVEEFEVRTCNAEAGVLVLMEILLIVVVAYISVPEIIHLVSAPSVEVLYLFPCPSRRFPDTAMYPERVMFVPEALVNRRAVIVVEAERRSSAVRAPLMVEMVDEVLRRLFEVTLPNKVVCVVDEPILKVNPGVEEPRSRVVEVMPR